MAKKIGIDLGTTYSVVSYVDDTGVICNVESSEGDKTTPSIVFFDPESTNVVVGSTAREAGALNPECLVERVKNYMGDPNYMKNVNGQNMSACAISSLILKKLVSDAEAWLDARGETIEGAVITCPAYFGDAAREATRLAGEAVELSNGEKLKVLKIMDEPTAAAIAYASSRQEDISKQILIYDLGGGTFDCTIMKLDNDKYDVITTGGDHKLGGKDWDNALIDYVRGEFCSETGCDEDSMKEDPESVAWFSEMAEKTKKMLTQKDSASMTPSFEGQKAKIEVTLDKFNEITRGLLRQSTSLVDQMLDTAKISIDEIDEIVLVGGSTRMRQVEEELKQHYNKPIVSFDPDKAVSNGAAIMANGLSADIEPDNVGIDPSDHILWDDFGQPALNNPGTVITDPNGKNRIVFEKCSKSYCIRYYFGGEEKYQNIVFKDSPKPAIGKVQGFQVGGGAPGTMVNEITMVIMENISLEKDVEKCVCEELYEEMPLQFAPPVRSDDIVDVELYVDLDGRLTLTLIEAATGIRHEMHPVRKGGQDVIEGLDNVSQFTLS